MTIARMLIAALCALAAGAACENVVQTGSCAGNGCAVQVVASSSHASR